MTEALRVVAYRTALALDQAAHHIDAQRREREGGVAALLTPVVKAFCTHQGFHGASAALQVFGGYGYVHDYGIEQTLRDARITMVYEGTNEIQAIDLVQRKLLADFDAEAARCDAEPGLGDFAMGLRNQSDMPRRAFDTLASRAADNREAALYVADDVLHGVAHTLLAWAFAVSARAALAEPDTAWAHDKIERMCYGMQWLLPSAAVHWLRVQAPRMGPSRGASGDTGGIA